MTGITLWFAPGTCARVTAIALEEAGAAFDTRVIAFMRGEHRSPEFLALNPAGKVPVLVIDGQVLTQNAAILTYVARRFPAAQLLPEAPDAAAQAAVLSRLAWFSADLHPLVTRIRMPQLVCDQKEAIPRVRELAMEAMRFQLGGVERHLAGQPWVQGAQWTAFDAYLYWVWFRITGAGFDSSDFPSLRAHAERMEQRPAVQRALAREESAQSGLEKLGLSIPGALRVTAA